MPVYKLKIQGVSKPVVVKASSQANARSSVVEVETMTADQLDEHIAAGGEVIRPDPAQSDNRSGEAEGGEGK